MSYVRVDVEKHANDRQVVTLLLCPLKQKLYVNSCHLLVQTPSCLMAARRVVAPGSGKLHPNGTKRNRQVLGSIVPVPYPEEYY